MGWYSTSESCRDIMATAFVIPPASRVLIALLPRVAVFRAQQRDRSWHGPQTVATLSARYKSSRRDAADLGRVSISLAASTQAGSDADSPPERQSKPRTRKAKKVTSKAEKKPESVAEECDGRVRCSWAQKDCQRYHDEEWGRPIRDDNILFEMLILESAQAGLSWRTILLRRDKYREAYAGFDPHIVAAFDENKIEELLSESSRIVRHRGKVNASIKAAQLVLQLQETHGSFASFLWSFVGGRPIQNHHSQASQLPTQTIESQAMSKALRALGFKFTGPTIMYAFMQAVGMVNDHTADCFCHEEVMQLATEWETFEPPHQL